MSEHTPGPWIIFGDGDIGELEIMPAGRAGSIAWIDFESTDETTPQSQEKLANARLIAAAPNMLAALKNMLHHFGNPKRDEWLNDEAFHHAVLADKEARAAIAKASPPHASTLRPEGTS